MKKFVKYNFIKNTKYALNGLKELILNETSFKIEFYTILTLWIILFFINIDFSYKMILAISLFIPLLAEGTNTAIEHTVDLVTQDFHHIAKKAKDVASAVVFMSFIVTFLIWASITYLIISNAS